jgi:hypothetical protein
MKKFQEKISIMVEAGDGALECWKVVCCWAFIFGQQ